MAQADVFPFIVADTAFGEASRLPYMPIKLQLQGRSLAVSALLDTGSAVNVLPYEVGLQLGAAWERQTTTVRLTGKLANEPARVLGIRLDTCPCCANHSWSGELLHGVRRLLLPIPVAF